MNFKVGDKVEYCGNIGEIYRIQDDKYFPMICVQFDNVDPNSEYKHKYLEFDLTGRTHSWTALPAITKVQ